MNTTNKTAAKGKNRTISIVSLVDVVGALASDNLDENIYLMDNNKPFGSHGEGTSGLQTAVEEGDVLIWTTASMEPEAYASISAIEIDSEICAPEKKTYPGSDVTYWSGKVKKSVKHCPYRLKVLVGTRTTPLQSSATPALIGKA